MIGLIGNDVALTKIRCKNLRTWRTGEPALSQNTYCEISG